MRHAPRYFYFIGLFMQSCYSRSKRRVDNSQESLSQWEEYERLGNRHESAAYQQIHYKGDDTIEMSSVYI
ncbi:hypothetical protein KUTeg_017311 [Tegillarca granosa]|uniref:Uncharacterized protein n=1 Tax=Tegillarca granosa TaxID=220873 RepID=A0ABQ9EIR6_TEGGR|nr:hypothetical protein KUTeg_017311 [Tegillarca granosa]